MAKYDEIFENVLKIPISEVFMKYGFHLKRCGSSWQLPSPFRKGSSSSSFTLSDKKNMFKDWVGEGVCGNSINFIERYYNVTYFEACMMIAKEFCIIDDNTYKRILSRKPTAGEIKHYEVAYKKVEKKKHVPADVDTLDKIYRIFISLTTLSDKHLDHLKNVRMLSDEVIEHNMFFSFPSRGMLRKFLKGIEDEFGTQDVLKDVPGFFKRKDEKNFTFNTSKGIGIPIFNTDGRIIGIQIRLDEISKAGLRYCWFSSGFADNDEEDADEETTCFCGTSSGSPIDVVFPTDLKFSGVFITEGKFKAIKIAEEWKCPVISLQGVSTWAPIIDILNKLPSVINSKYSSFTNWKIRRIYPAFDADMSRNIGVYKQLFNMTNKIEESISEEVKTVDFRIEYLFWDVNIAKGIDDLINIYTGKDLIDNTQRIVKKDFDEAYARLIKKVLELNPGLTESSITSNITSEEFQNYFDKYFYVGSH